MMPTPPWCSCDQTIPLGFTCGVHGHESAKRMRVVCDLAASAPVAASRYFSDVHGLCSKIFFGDVGDIDGIQNKLRKRMQTGDRDESVLFWLMHVCDEARAVVLQRGDHVVQVQHGDSLSDSAQRGGSSPDTVIDSASLVGETSVDSASPQRGDHLVELQRGASPSDSAQRGGHGQEVQGNVFLSSPDTVIDSEASVGEMSVDSASSEDVFGVDQVVFQAVSEEPPLCKPHVGHKSEGGGLRRKKTTARSQRQAKSTGKSPNAVSKNDGVPQAMAPSNGGKLRKPTKYGRCPLCKKALQPKLWRLGWGVGRVPCRRVLACPAPCGRNLWPVPAELLALFPEKMVARYRVR